MFTKRLLIYLIIVSLFGCANLTKQIDYSGMKNVNNELMIRFKAYWYYRLKQDVENSKKFEAPHIQYIVNDKDYSVFIKAYHEKANIGKIIAYDLVCEKEFYCCVLDKYYGKNGKYLTEGKDCWVKVKNKWYHNIYNPIMFPYIK